MSIYTCLVSNKLAWHWTQPRTSLSMARNFWFRWLSWDFASIEWLESLLRNRRRCGLTRFHQSNTRMRRGIRDYFWAKLRGSKDPKVRDSNRNAARSCDLGKHKIDHLKESNNQQIIISYHTMLSKDFTGQNVWAGIDHGTTGNVFINVRVFPPI